MAIFSNISGTWKKVSKVFNNVSGTWREVKKAFTNVGGTWKQLHSSAAQFTYTSSQPTNGRSIVLTDIFDAATIAANTNFVITVNAGVTLGTSTGVPVFDFSAVTGKTITIINNGTIKGGVVGATNYYARETGYGCNWLKQPVYLDYPEEAAYVVANGTVTKASSCGNLIFNWSTNSALGGGCQNEYWALYSSAPASVVTAIVNGSNTVTVSGNAVVNGSIGTINYYTYAYKSCNCDCGGTSG